MNGAVSLRALGAAAVVAAVGLSANAERIWGLTTTNELISFQSANPLMATGPMAITGLGAGVTLMGIDFRPATGSLFGLGSNSQLYTINTSTGAAVAVGPGPFTTLLSGNSFGFDFNPTVDRIRITSNTGQNLRANPDTGVLASVDGGLNYVAGDISFGQPPAVVASAYTNNFAGATTTTLYNIDAVLDMLVKQDPPNAGGLVSIGGTGEDITNLTGFDISTNGNAYVAIERGGVPSWLYSIDLSTGSMSLIGEIGAGMLLADISVAIPAPGAAGLLAMAGVVAGRRRR